MKPSLEHKLQQLSERFDEVRNLITLPEIIEDQNQFKALTKEFAQIEPIANDYLELKNVLQNIEEAKVIIESDDAEMALMAKEELSTLNVKVDELTQALQVHLIPKDPFDEGNVFLEIRAGTGGDEAAIFVGDLFKMYSRYAEQERWQVEIMTAHESTQGGYKEIIARIIGQNVYSKLKFESGAHRVQRVPETESQGRVHTSACTVAILPECDEIEDIVIKTEDLRIDTYRSSGAGGQHVNKTDSAVRITHLPTGVVVECQDERSQHKNKARAMSLLKTRILTQEQSKQRDEQAQKRKLLVGSGDRSERIRTYNYPQGRLTDHRINLTLYQLTEILDGDLNAVIDPLKQEYQAEQLAALSQSDDV